MQISMVMCGFSAGESDSRIRKPVAKKKIKLLTSTVFHWEDGKDETTYDHWMNGAENNGYSREIAQKIWDDVLEFASYAFNKSHSAGYAILVMQTAWLKAYYPREFMAAVLTSYTGKTDKIVHYVSSCKREGIQILPPDVNESGTEFTATPEGVRFGLAGIRGVGEGAAECILAERAKGGPFKHLNDFVDRVDGSQANRRVVEALIKAGAFDSTGYPRLQLMRMVDKNNPSNIIDAAARRQKERASGQTSLLDLFGGDGGAATGLAEDIPAPDGQEWDRHVKLAQEKGVLGIYVSDHPLSPYEYALTKARDYTLSELVDGRDVVLSDGSTRHIDVAEGKSCWVAGMVSGFQKKVTSKGDAMAVFTLEDMEGELPIVVFPKAFKECGQALAGEVDEQTGEAVGDVFVRALGRLERGDRGDQFIASKVEALILDDQHNKPKVLEVNLPTRYLNRPFLTRLQSVFVRYPGLDGVELCVTESTGSRLRMNIPTRVDAKNIMLFAEVRDMVGNDGQVVVA